MDVFYHLMYEHGRGLRDLALYTVKPEQLPEVKRSLELENIHYLMRPIKDGRINIYFGHKACVDVVQTFGACPHFKLTPEQDFILGIMLGYDRTRQCERYLNRSEHATCGKTHCRNQEPHSTCNDEQDNIHTMS